MLYLNEPEILSLNLILDYPVRWSKYKVLRDFIQNFYDALNWLRLSGKKYRLVQEGFSALGYPTLEDVCEKNGGFSILREPLTKEIPLLKLLEEFTAILFKDFFGNEILPSVQDNQKRKRSLVGHGLLCTA